jgi:homogentisate phytyltransferase/homogentisate geranylgeranyltransferase
MRKAALILWKFSRPHTIIGSVISISALYAMVAENESEHLLLLLFAILIGISCNIYIVGINQIEDVELDKINKPFLPMASGELSVKNAKVIVYVSFVFCSILAGILSPLLLGIVLISMGIGWAYSRPPIYLRKHHLPAALSISIVRGVLVNLGGFLVFQKLIYNSYKLNGDIIALVFFVVVFSIVIAWFKDIPDVKGDKIFKLKSLPILYSSKTVLNIGYGFVSVAYITCIVYFGTQLDLHVSRYAILFYGHIILLLAFTVYFLKSNKNDKKSLRRFYKTYWLFFFAEYLVFMFAFIN